MYRTLILVLIMIITCIPVAAQDAGSEWTRSESTELPPLELFHSTQGINLPTATRLNAGEMEFEISHRFIPTIKDGVTSLYGFDGPVNIRIALGYAFSDNGIVTLGRSNLQDNLDLNVKHTLLTLRHDFVPLHLAARAGAAINTEIPGREAWDADNLQTYVQFIANTLIEKKLGLGIVPSYLFNSHPECVETQYSLTLGLHAQYYFTDTFNVLAEWNPTLSGWREGYNAMSFGIELETGGHFFKIIMSNSDLLNPSQFLAGAPDSFTDGAWRIGFNITRILIF